MNRSLAALVASGVLVRLLFWWASGDLEFWLDEAEYTYLALAWNRFGIYLGSLRWLWPPGYPAILSWFLHWGGESGIAAIKLAQVLCSASVGTCVVLLARRLFCQSAARWAGILWAIYLPLIGFTHYLWAESFLLAVLFPGLWLALLAFDEPDHPWQPWRIVGAGLCFGIAILIKEAVLPLFLLLALGFLFLRSSPMGSRIRKCALFVTAGACVLSPWGLRNQQVYGTWITSGSTLGQNLFWGVNAQYSNFDYAGIGKVVDKPHYRWMLEPPGPLWERSDNPHLVERSKEDTQRAWQFVQEYPGYVLRSRLKKLADWFTPLSFFIRHYQLDLYQPPLSSAGVRHALVLASVLLTMLVFVGGVGGLGRLQNPSHRWFAVVVILSFLAFVPLVSSSRFRVPVEPLLLVLTGGFLASFGRDRLSRRSLLWCAAGWALLASLWGIQSAEVFVFLGEVL